MRKIKIRAWDKKDKKWLDGNEWAFDPEKSKAWYLEFGEMMDVIEDVIIVQYVGLRDMNVKEIWEGDIVKMELEKTVVKGKIKYHSSSFYLATDCDLWDLDNYKSIEVIGNIYENPDLIKSKKEEK